jgi:hypothetical protein
MIGFRSRFTMGFCYMHKNTSFIRGARKEEESQKLRKRNSERPSLVPASKHG